MWMWESWINGLREGWGGLFMGKEMGVVVGYGEGWGMWGGRCVDGGGRVMMEYEVW